MSIFLHTRRAGSQRSAKAVRLDTTSVESEDRAIAFKGDDDLYYFLTLETEADVKGLLSIVHQFLSRGGYR